MPDTTSSIRHPLASTRTLLVPPAGLEGLTAAIPICTALADSGRRLTMTIEEDLAPLARLVGSDPELIVREAGGVPPPVLEENDFDEAVVLDDSLGAALWVRGTGIPSWGYRGGLRRFVLHRAVPRPKRTAGRLRPQYFQDLRRAMGMPDEENPRPARFEISDDLREQARERLERGHLHPDEGPLLGIYAGRQGGFGKPWPRKRFEELLRRLRRERPTTQAIVLATTDDLWKAVRVYEETGKIHPVLGPDLSLELLVAVLGELDLLIAGDSRFLHLAAAAGTSTFGFFLRDPELWGPQGEEHRAVRRPSLKALSVDEVQELLNG